MGEGSLSLTPCRERAVLIYKSRKYKIIDQQYRLLFRRKWAIPTARIYRINVTAHSRAKRAANLQISKPLSIDLHLLIYCLVSHLAFYPRTIRQVLPSAKCQELFSSRKSASLRGRLGFLPLDSLEDRFRPRISQYIVEIRDRHKVPMVMQPSEA